MVWSQYYINIKLLPTLHQLSLNDYKPCYIAWSMSFSLQFLNSVLYFHKAWQSYNALHLFHSVVEVGLRVYSFSLGAENVVKCSCFQHIIDGA